MSAAASASLPPPPPPPPPTATTAATKTVTIDGSRGEGGGQILRNAIAYATMGTATITANQQQQQQQRQQQSASLRIHKIRAGRSNPGLRAQHLTGIQLAVDIANNNNNNSAGSSNGGRLEGGSVGSMEISYVPPQQSNDLANGYSAIATEDVKDNSSATATTSSEHYLTGDTGTAGSIVLLLQTALPCALFAPASTTTSTRLRLRGGTNASLAPQYDYWERVFWPTVSEQCGLPSDQVRATVVRRGFFPRGGGQVDVTVRPLRERPLRPVRLTDRGQVAQFHIRSFHAGNLPRHLAEQMAAVARSALQARYPTVPVETEIVTERDAVGSGMGILAVATTTTGCRLAGSALGVPRKQTARGAGAAAARELLQTLEDGGCVDEWLQDQLILFMALAGDGPSEVLTGSLTLHTRTALWIAEELSGGAQFEVIRVDSGRTCPTGVPETAAETASEYGKEGRIPGKHLIRCRGTGFLKR